MNHPAHYIRNTHAFTLIELIVVITILAAVAMIALPSLIGQSDKAHDAASKSDLVNVYREAAPLWAEKDEIPANIASQLGGSIPVEAGSHWSTDAVTVSRLTPTAVVFRREADSGNRFMIFAPLKGKAERYSTKPGDQPRVNEIIVPSFEHSSTPGLHGAGGAGSGYGTNRARDTNVSRSGNASMRIEVNPNLGNPGHHQAYGFQFEDNSAADTAPGDKWTCSFYARALPEGGDAPIRIHRVQRDVNGVSLEPKSSPVMTVPDDGRWHRMVYSYTITHPDTIKTHCYLAVQAPATYFPGESRTVWIDDALLERGGEQPYFPTPDHLDAGLATWSGAANLSKSSFQGSSSGW